MQAVVPAGEAEGLGATQAGNSAVPPTGTVPSLRRWRLVPAGDHGMQRPA